MTINYKHFQKKLEEEKIKLEKELGEVGTQNPDNPSDWQAVPSDRDSSQADENTVADSIESFDENQAIISTLEARYKDVVDALHKIEQGTYGTCEVSGEEIDHERLEANPAARTCREHM